MDSYLKRLQQVIASATEGMTAEELLHHPEGKWSTAEVLEHLYLSYTGTAKGCARCLEAGKPFTSKPTRRQSFQAFVVAELGYFPRGRSAPERTRPKGMAPEKVAPEIASAIDRMDELISQCESKYGKRIKVLDHPVLGPLTAQQWRKFHWVHGRHHVKQIRRLRALASAPRLRKPRRRSSLR
jgi:Protein of unknown function (DUF1569)